MTEEDEEFERIEKKRQYLINYIMEPPLVSKQKEWVGLTDEEIQECLQGLPTQTIDVYARRIEDKLNDKNT